MTTITTADANEDHRQNANHIHTYVSVQLYTQEKKKQETGNETHIISYCN